MSITSANAVFMITAAVILPTPQKLEAWASDSSFMQDDVELAQEEMGVDGFLTAGYTPNPKPQSLKFLADSPSLEIMELIRATMDSTRDIIRLQGVLTLESTGESWNFINGILKRAPVAKSAQKVLQAQTYGLVWQDVRRSIL